MCMLATAGLLFSETQLLCSDWPKILASVLGSQLLLQALLSQVHDSLRMQVLGVTQSLISTYASAVPHLISLPSRSCKSL